MPPLKPLAEQVVVITGASSGIGLATARLAAERGARVVLAARTRDALAQAVDEINHAGPGRASFVEADVGDHAAHEKIAAHAIERHGRIDTWINNAGVLVFGKLQDLPEADMRQLFETNFWGIVHGSIVAVRHLGETGGALINVGSLESDRGLPLQGIYAASKHAVKAFTETLRMELEHDGAPVSVTLVKPGAIGTPLPQHTRSHTGEEPRFPPPIYRTEEVARSILAAAERPTRTVYVGAAARVGSALGALMPRTMDRVMELTLVGGQRSGRPAPATDNLYTGGAEARVVGEGSAKEARPSLYSAASRNPLTTVAAAGGIAAGAFLLFGRRDRAARRRENGAPDLPVEGA